MSRPPAPIWRGWASIPTVRSGSRERLACMMRRLTSCRGGARVYPCYETAQELELKRKIQLGRGKPPIYDRGALALTDDDRTAKEAEGISPHWRFKLDHSAPIAWDDGVRGPQKFDASQIVRSGDPARRRQLALHAAQRGRRYRNGHRRSCCAARIMCRILQCKCRCSKRWAPLRRVSRMRLCWWARKVNCRNGLVRSAAMPFANAGLSPKP